MIFAGSKKKDTVRSIAIALLLNTIALLLIFFFIRWKKQDPPPEDLTVELSMADFGYTNAGNNFTDGAPQTEKVVQEAPTEEAIVDNSSQTAANVQDKPSEATKPSETQTQETAKPEQTVSNGLNNALDAMTGGGDGNNNTQGDQGNPSGKIEGKGVFGNGSGWALSGRSMTGKPSFNGSPKKNGTVQVRIKVDKNGKVTDATVVNSLPTNTPDAQLRKLALDAARTAKFNKDEGAKIRASGTITFVFKVN